MSSECRRLHPRLVELADGNLAGAEQSAVEAHVAACPDCRRELESLRADTALLRSLPEPPVPDGLEPGVMWAVRSSARPVRRPALQLVFVRAGAVALFALGLLLGVGVGLGITGGLRSDYPAGRPGGASTRGALAAEFPGFDEEIPW
ncbi:MAG: zf-HC2 domain-containing protein [bacterium]